MSRVAKKITCSENILIALQKAGRSKTIEARLSERAQIILKFIEGFSNKEVGLQFKMQAVTVAKWRSRFIQMGLDGLNDFKRSGAPPKYQSSLRDDILKKLEETPPNGLSTWDGGSIAKALNVSDAKVWRILRSEGIQLRRHRTWCVSKDSEFEQKSVDIIGLYLAPPQNALVFCIDEKPSIQAIERTMGYVKTSSGKIDRGMKSTYKRNGVLNLFAALNVASGTIQSKITDTKKRTIVVEKSRQQNHNLSYAA